MLVVMPEARIGPLEAVALGIASLAAGVVGLRFCMRSPSWRNEAVPRAEMICVFFIVMGVLFAGTGLLMAVGVFDSPS